MLESLGPWIGYGLWALLLLIASLLVYLGLAGNFVVLGLALVHAALSGFAPIGWTLLAILLGIALLGELLEFLIGTFTATARGAGKGATIGGFVGGLAGAAAGHAVIPVVGAVPGSFVGAFAGAVLGEMWRRRNLPESLRIGVWSLVGRVAAILVKHALGLVMILLILRETYPG